MFPFNPDHGLRDAKLVLQFPKFGGRGKDYQWVGLAEFSGLSSPANLASECAEVESGPAPNAVRKWQLCGEYPLPSPIAFSNSAAH